MAVTAEVNLTVTGNQTTALDLGTAAFPFAKSLAYSLTSGVAAGMVDMVFTDTRTLTASATENLDMAGVLVGAFGTTLTFVTVKAVFVIASAANTNDVQVTRPAANGAAIFMAASDGIALKPGYAFAWFGSGTGVTVTAGTGDLVTVTNSAGGTSVVYDVVILGTSS